MAKYRIGDTVIVGEGARRYSANALVGLRCTVTRVYKPGECTERFADLHPDTWYFAGTQGAGTYNVFEEDMEPVEETKKRLEKRAVKADTSTSCPFRWFFEPKEQDE